jgi:hypothetical protein
VTLPGRRLPRSALLINDLVLSTSGAVSAVLRRAAIVGSALQIDLTFTRGDYINSRDWGDAVTEAFPLPVQARYLEPSRANRDDGLVIRCLAGGKEISPTERSSAGAEKRLTVHLEFEPAEGTRELVVEWRRLGISECSIAID